MKKRSARTALAPFHTFLPQMHIVLSRLATGLPSASVLSFIGARRAQQVQPMPCDLLTLELGPFASLNARLVEWLIEKYTAVATYLVGA